MLAALLLAGWLAPLAAAARTAPKPNPTAPPTLCNSSGARAGSEIIRQADRLAGTGKTASAAQHLYDVVLGDARSTPADRDCAARGLAVLATAPVAAARRSAGQRAQGAWDAFYASWVSPAVGYGVPALVVFALLLAAARVMTSWTPRRVIGPRSRGLATRIMLKLAYAAAVLGAALSALGLTVGLAWASEHHPQAAGRLEFTIGWALVGMVLVAAGVAWAWLAWARARTPHRFKRWPIVLAAVAALAACLGPSAGTAAFAARFDAPDHDVAAGELIATAVPLAVVAITVVAWLRGTSLGVRLRGHNAKGDDDAGLAQQVLTKLQAIGAHKPRGIQTVQQTDVSSLSGSALALLPDGTLSKAIAFLVQLFQPATPWSIDVADCGDGGFSVVVARNGSIVDSSVIRAERLGFAVTAAAPAGGQATGADAAPALDKRQIALCTASAAYALVTLADYNHHLSDGLCGATKWPSVAAQAIATDPSVTVDEDAKRRLLSYAVALDSANLTARAAFLLAVYRARGAGHRETVDYAARSEALLEVLDKPHRRGAPRLRRPAPAVAVQPRRRVRQHLADLPARAGHPGRARSRHGRERGRVAGRVQRRGGRRDPPRAGVADPARRGRAGPGRAARGDAARVHRGGGVDRARPGRRPGELRRARLGRRTAREHDARAVRAGLPRPDPGPHPCRPVEPDDRDAVARQPGVGPAGRVDVAAVDRGRQRPGPAGIAGLQADGRCARPGDVRRPGRFRGLPQPTCSAGGFTDPAEFGTRRFAQAVTQLGVSANLLAEWRGLAELYLHVEGRRGADVQPSTPEIVHALGRVGVRTVDQLLVRTADDEQLDALHWKLIVAAQGYAFTIPPRGALQRWRDPQPA